MVIFKVTVIADSGNRYANVEISNFPSSSACKLHSSAASDKIQWSVYNSFCSAVPKLKLDSFLELKENVNNKLLSMLH